MSDDEDDDDAGGIFDEINDESLFDKGPPIEEIAESKSNVRVRKTNHAVINPESARVTPHHTEAEQAVIAACVHDQSGLSFRKCVLEGIHPNVFYRPAHQSIWEAMLSLQADGINHDEVVLTKRLHEMGELDAIGGGVYLNEVLNRVETHAHVHSHIDIVVELSVRRSIIRGSQQVIEDVLNVKDLEEVSDSISKMAKQMDRMQINKPFEMVPLTSFTRPDINSPDQLLGKHRYLCRGGGMVFVGSAGIGKTSASLQMAACWGCGRDFVGITAHHALRVLICQAEDDDGDIGEVWQSLNYGLNFSMEERDLIKQNVKIVRDKVNTGEKFLKQLPHYIEQHKPDIVMLNPLLSFIGGDISRQEVTSAFLRNGLNKINSEDKFAYILIHHTNKPPPKDSKTVTNWSEKMYNMAGSAELVNWPRAILCLEPSKEEGMFWLRLAKRGNRAGVMATRGDTSTGQAPYNEPTTKLAIKHCRAIQELDDGRQVPMIMWERIIENTEEYELMYDKKSTDKPGKKAKHDAEVIISCFPVGKDKAAPGARIKQEADSTYGIGKTQFYAFLKLLMDQEIVKKDSITNRYYRD